MRGIVVHSRGHFRRCLEGRNNEARLTVKAVMPVPPQGTGCLTAQSRPVHFLFYYGSHAFAGSKRVVLLKGRRYPDVEHWFILPDETECAAANELQLISAADRHTTAVGG